MKISKKGILGISVCGFIVVLLVLILMRFDTPIISTAAPKSVVSKSDVKISSSTKSKSSKSSSKVTSKTAQSTNSEVSNTHQGDTQNYDFKNSTLQSLNKFSKENLVTLKLLTQESDFASPILKQEGTDEKIINTVELLNSAITSFINPSLKSATSYNNKIFIFLVDSLKEGTASAQYYYKDEINFVFISINKCNEKDIRIILSQAMSKSMVKAAKSGAFKLAIGALNPDDFTYGTQKSQYVYDEVFTKNTRFLSSKAQMDPFYDLEEFFLEYLTNKKGVKNLAPSFPAFYKLAYVQDVAKQIYKEN